MTIAFPCPSCGASLQVGEHLTGQQVSCPSCTAVTTVPKPQAMPGANPYGDRYPPDYSTPPGPVNPYGAPTPYQTPQANYQVAMPTRQVVLTRTRPAAIVWLVVSVLNFIMLVLAMFGGVMNLMENGQNQDDMVTLIICGIMCVVATFGACGAILMLKMKWHTVCIIAAAGTMISGFACCFIPSGVGVWAIVMLLLPGTRDQFQ